MTDDIDTEPLERAIARANANTATAITRMAGLSSTPHSEGILRAVHPALCDSYSALCRSLDAVEHALDDLDENRHGTPTPRRLKRDRADSLQVEFDGPVVTVALMLLESNRREWLHNKDNTLGADEVRNNGLTATQYHQLERLQRAWDVYDEGSRVTLGGEIQQTIATLRGEATELRERNGECDVADQLEHRADELETAYRGGIDE